MHSRLSGVPLVVAADSAGRASARLGRDRQLTLLIGVTLFAYYLLVLGGHHYSIDGIVMFQAAKRLFFHHSLVLDSPVLWDTAVIRASGWSLGLTLAYLPLLARASPLFYWVPSLQEIPYNPSLPYNPALYSNLPYLLCSWLNPLITAVTGCLVFRLARLLGMTPRWAAAAALAYGVASPAAAYARFDFAQPLAGLVLTAAVWRLLTTSPAFPLRPLFLTGAILGFAFLTRPEFAVLIAWILAWMLFHCRGMSRRSVLERAAVLAGPVGIAVGIYVATNWFKFGGAFDMVHKPLAYLFPGSPRGTFQGVIGLLASPLVSGWAFLWVAPLDLPLVKLWRAGRVAAFLVWLVATLGVAAGLAWAGYRIRVLLGESRAGNVGGLQPEPTNS